MSTYLVTGGAAFIGSHDVACGERASLLSLLETLGSPKGRWPNISDEADRTGGVRDSIADIDRVQGVLRYGPAVGLSEGPKEAADWARRDARCWPIAW